MRNSSPYEQETKWLSKCTFNLFFICGSELLILLILYDLGAETNISDVYCSSSDLAYIYRRIQDGRHFRYLLLK